MMVSSKIILILSIAALLGCSEGFQKWTSLRVTWCPGLPDPVNCFLNVPLTLNDTRIKSEGWRQVNKDCLNDDQFYGLRYIKGDNLGFSPLYDINGIIAGIQMNLLKSELFAKSNPFQYTKVPDFLSNFIDGKEVYSVTVYFVEPEIICRGGRSEPMLKSQGVGTRLFFQHGESPMHLIRAPLYRNIAIEKDWSENQCVNSMGYHNYYDVPNMYKDNCTTMRPSFLLFNNYGELHGFGQVGVGFVNSTNFEHPDRDADKVGLGTMTPECMMEISDTVQFSNMHFFFVDEPLGIKCTTLVQTPLPLNGDFYTNPNAYNWVEERMAGFFERVKEMGKGVFTKIKSFFTWN